VSQDVGNDHTPVINGLVVTETAKGTDVRPLERKPTVAVDNLLSMVAFGSRDPDTLTTLASRVSRLDRQIDVRDRQTTRVHKDHDTRLSLFVNEEHALANPIRRGLYTGFGVQILRPTLFEVLVCVGKLAGCERFTSAGFHYDANSAAFDAHSVSFDDHSASFFAEPPGT
jgi:hypothetical protein